MVLEVAGLVDAALRGDDRTLRRTCAAALADGCAVADLVVDVLAPVQREVGRRWLAGEATVADEHRATGALDTVLAAFELGMPASTRAAPVVCVCAEGEWHAMAARMVALVLASDGWPVVFLGPSLPAADLAAVAREVDAAAVAVSTGSVAALPGAARCLRAVADVGRPVVLGGQAFQAVPAAAIAFGAPVFTDPREASAAIPELPLARRPLGLADQEVLNLDSAESRLLGRTKEMLRARDEIAPWHRSVLYEAAGYVVGFARTAILFHDRSVVTSHMAWLDTFLHSRGVDVDGVELLATVDEAGAQVLDDPCVLHAVMAA